MKKIIVLLITIFLITLLSVNVYAYYFEHELTAEMISYDHFVYAISKEGSEMWIGSNDEIRIEHDGSSNGTVWVKPIGGSLYYSVYSSYYRRWNDIKTTGTISHADSDIQYVITTENIYHPITGEIVKYPNYQRPRSIIGMILDGTIFSQIEGINFEYDGFLGNLKLSIDKVGAGANANVKTWIFKEGKGQVNIPKEDIPIVTPGDYRITIYDNDEIVSQTNFTYNYTYNQIDVDQSDVDKTPFATELPERIRAYMSESTPYKPMLLSLEKLKTFDTSDYRTLCPELHINLGDLLNAASSYISPDLVGKLNIDVIYFDLSVLNEIEFIGIPVIQYMRNLLSAGMILYTALHIYHGFIPEKAIIGG